ncbi:hypothetical protein GCM10011577_13590 [Pseudarthrobacter polychromogenes]|uniref:Uncharacterized protein n=1 Tax=Pseudarthrobacter polychromogenes TaxID=1676 RepID=A0ABQ1XEG1_9MICC|nr:hypothetical protein GCM10011577_13590 [Pseudarthrobacter polychromogenes]
MAGVHGLEHVQRFPATDLAHHDPVRAHAQRVPQQFADGDLALALGVRRAAFEPDHVLLLDLQFHGVLDGHDPLVRGQEGGQHVEKGGFAGAGTAGDDDVELGFDAGVEQLGHLGGEGAEVDQVADSEGDLAEFTDGQ